MKNSHLILFVLLCSAMHVKAQQEKGDTQMRFSFSFSSQTADGTTSSSLQLQYGYSKFFTKHLEMGLDLIAFGQTNSSTFYYSPFFNYNALSKNGKFVFYFGAQYLLSFSSFEGGGSTTSGGVGGKAGIKSFLSPNVFLFVGPNFTAFANDVSLFKMEGGIGVLFKKIKKTQ
jgi:hypothetical protein